MNLGITYKMKKNNKIILIFAICLIAIVALSSCNAEKSLIARTVRYHNYIYGHGSIRDRLSNYWSPALVEQYKSINKKVPIKTGKKDYTNFDFEQDRINQLNQHSGITVISRKDVSVLINKKWAVSNIKPTKGLPEGLLYRWVNVNNRWYIYKGSLKEVEKYGKFVYPSK